MALNYEEMSWRDVRDHFRKWRKDKESRSDDVIRLWQAILEYDVRQTGKERHMILEQVIVAALDTSRFDIAARCINELNVEFPGSLLVMNFEAMRLQAMERFTEAFEVLDAIIAKDETNAEPRKRKIAILKAQGRRVDAIMELNEYLKIFMSDQEAWQDLCNLYMAGGDYTKAAFCTVPLKNSHSADIRYTILSKMCSEVNELESKLERLKERQAADDVEKENLESQIAALQGLEVLSDVYHDQQIQGLKDDAQKWRLKFVRIEEENVRLRRVKNDIEVLRREKVQAEKLCEMRGLRNEMLKNLPHSFQNTFQSFYDKNNKSSWRNRISIRNFPPTVASDPKKEILAILTHLSIDADPHSITIMSCTEMVVHKPLHQIFVRFEEVHVKLQLIAKFSLLSCYEDDSLRNLELRDGLDTTAIVRNANGSLEELPYFPRGVVGRGDIKGIRR